MRKRYDFTTPEQFDGIGEDYETSRRNSIHSMHVVFGILLFCYLGGLYWLIYFLDGLLPTALKVSDEAAYPDAFIGERAHHDLKLLTDLGPRIAGGYENEVLAVDFLKREINFIIQQSNKNQKIELDFQTVSGAYNLTFHDVTAINTYTNVQNVVVKLHGASNAQNSLLVNSHFDSVPTSPGASDDGINVAAMLEVLRKISRRPDRLRHNVVFLFNGAEETPLEASHGFISQHKWAKECKVVVNLEACGHGGKIILFQTGPRRPWLMKYYSRVPHPYGQAAGEEIFQSEIIPSDTDFRIFRDYGGVVGLDMAFYKNGYVYHTKFDEFDTLAIGSVQNVGDNVLSLVKNLANATEMDDDEALAASEGNVVYFDVLGWFMISYTEVTGLILNFLTVGLSIVIFAKSLIDFGLGCNKLTLKYLSMTFGAMVAGWVCSVLCVAFIGFVLDKLRYSMSWYTYSWIIGGLFVVPTIVITGYILTYLNSKNLSINTQAQLQAHIVRLFWTFLLFIGAVLNLRSSYALFIPIMFNSVIFVIIHLFKLQYSVRKWQIIYVIGLFLPTAMLMYQMCTVLALFVPLTGRIGSDKNNDVMIGLLAAIFTIVVTSPYMVFITLIRKAHYLLLGLAAIFVITFIIVFTPLGFPYSGDRNSPTPQRYWIVHTNRIIHRDDSVNKESGYFLLNMDRNSPHYVENIVKDFERQRSVTKDCEKYSLCGLPLAHFKMMQIMKYSTWIPAGPPIIRQPATLEVRSKEYISTNIIRLNVTVNGPDRLSMYIVPLPNMTLVDTTLVSPPPKFTEHDDKHFYYILNTVGKEASPLNFTFDVKVPDRHQGPVVDFVVNAIYVHLDNTVMRTPHYQEFINSFPDWADVTAWLGSYESWHI